MSVKSSNSKAADALNSSVQGAGYLVLLQLSTRAASFILNLILLRLTSSRVLGVVSVELELLLSTILFLSREGIRMSILRTSEPASADKNHHAKSPTKTSLQPVFNLAYLPILTGLAMIMAVLSYHLFYKGPQRYGDRAQHDMTIAVGLYSLGALFELLSEPIYVLSQVQLQYNIRVRAEGLAVFCKTLTTLAVMYFFVYMGTLTDGFAIIAFAVAQAVYGLVLLVMYGYNLGTLPRFSKLDSGAYFDSGLSHLAWSFTLQSMIKHLLTEGDKIVLVGSSTAEDMGVYAYVSNYGSLIARILFQPVEETMRAYFSKVLNNSSISGDEAKSVLSVLTMLVKTHFLLGSVFVFFATNYSTALVSIIGGKTWSATSAPQAFAAYCLYVPVMGINGITEGFLQGVASEKTLNTQSIRMVGFWLIFIGSGWLFMGVLKMGAVGLILANMVNLFLRINLACTFIGNFFQDLARKLDDKEIKQLWTFEAVVPRSMAFWGCCVASWLITYWSERYIGIGTPRQMMLHIGIGIFCFAITAFVGYKTESQHVRRVRDFIKAIKRK
ncbi:hypothetical protein SeMB42_g03248 [Synchytrium endobioticum]|uniref:Man(5)GlcNAc(2)-PP-dolichol translocation protein RFT1 n=1 Tax=Synchytrium endobioticum TaxID=286115 RepID=A0A507D8C8_9FUNG|nr:hypothetical protein SeLEV6574_g04911 [Synchytrium endobioticum]TPX47671.1 hypothetical protein SeMB42_g03248 [Synchytrium endobioticum]